MNNTDKKQYPIRVLHYIKHLNTGGGEMLLYNILKNIDRDKVQFDFLVNDAKEEYLTEEVKKLGARVIPLLEEEPKSWIRKITQTKSALRELLKKGDYDIFHVHCSNGQGLIYSNIAKKAGVKHRIVHIHNCDVDGKFKGLKRFFHNWCKRCYMMAPTDYMACSSDAARWLYSKDIIRDKKYEVITNGINIEQFAYNEEIRHEYREKLKWSDKKILINIGRMEEEKNQLFLLDIMRKLIEKDASCRLLIIGNGSLDVKIRNKIHNEHLEDYVSIIEYTDEVEKYLWAADYFILPSLKEGLGIVAIEAQAAGLPTIVSDCIPVEVNVTDLIVHEALKNGSDKWSDSILTVECNRERAVYNAKVKAAGYSIKDTAKRLQDIYMEMDDR